MTTNVNLHNVTVDNVITLAIEVIFETLDTTLVTRDNRRRKYDSVITLQFNEAMIIGHDTRERGILLALFFGLIFWVGLAFGYYN